MLEKTEWNLQQPVVIYCPALEFYVRIVFRENGAFDCYQCFLFDPDCILSLEEAIDPINFLAATPRSNYGYQILKVSKIPEGSYFIKHIRSAI